MSWKETLKAKGKTDAEIAEIEKAVGASGAIFDEIISGADLRLAEATEKEKKLNTWWENDATKQINETYSKLTNAQAEAAFYRTQAEEAKKAGFIKADAPGFTPPTATTTTTTTPTFQPGQNPVPGSPGAPQYMTVGQATAALSGAAYLITEHQRLFNEPLPDLDGLMTEAVNTGKKAKDVWETKYNVAAKRQAIAEAAQKAHDDKVRQEERERVTREMADRYGNDGTRPQRTSAHPEYIPKDATGKPDKLAWAKDDRRTNLRQRIHEQVAKEQTSRVQ